mgnify:CR=1 FL=1|jgi:hypothetical protein
MSKKSVKNVRRSYFVTAVSRFVNIVELQRRRLAKKLDPFSIGSVLLCLLQIDRT